MNLSTASEPEIEQMITRLGIHATPATSFTSVEDGYAEALREVLRLRARVSMLENGLRRISLNEGVKEGICPYGCDSPWVAQHALDGTLERIGTEDPSTKAEIERDAIRAENERLREHREDLSRENARLAQLLSGRDETLLSRETHE